LSTNWRQLNRELGLMSEEQVLALLNDERAGAKRLSILQRLHQRFCILRAARERKVILDEARGL
jgi:hypothetical protein